MRRPFPFSLPAPVVAAVAAGAAYANAVAADFQFDDFGDVVGNPSAEAATFLERLPATVRPLLKASYALQDAAHGPWAPGYHAVNLALHVVAAALAAALLVRAARLAGLEARAGALFAAAVAALWAVHPALTETVTYVSGRSMGLSSVLVLATLLAATGRQAPTARLAAFAGAALAPLARETALIAPAILLWWQLTLQPREPFRAALARAAPVWIGAGLAAAIVFAMPRHADLVAFSLAQRPPLLALRNNLHAVPEILSVWFAPWAVTIDPATPLFWPWENWRTLAKLAAILSAAGIALALRRRAPLVAFGLGLAGLALVPTNSIVWRLDPVGLKPLYLSGLGLTLALAAAALPLARRAPRASLAAAAALALALGLASVQRNALFADPVALWTDAAAKAPEKGRPWIMLGYALIDEARYAEAVDALDRGLALEPWDAQAETARAAAAALRDATPP